MYWRCRCYSVKSPEVVCVPEAYPGSVMPFCAPDLAIVPVNVMGRSGKVPDLPSVIFFDDKATNRIFPSVCCATSGAKL
jgi:hypothetical protein